MSATKQTLEERIIGDLRSQRSFRFSSAWRPRKSAAVVVPIIRDGSPRARGYLTIQEAKAVEIQDTGSIGAVRITNKEKLPVFVRVGSILQGKGTQSRAVSKSVMIAPGQMVEAKVNCVHHSHHIDMTAAFVAQSAHLAPASVEKELVGGDQGRVWSAVSNYGAAKHAMGGGEPAERGDNLAGMMDLNDRFTELVDELAKEIPNHEQQVGVVVFDDRGVYGLEVFGSPESWRVFNDAVVEKFGEVLVRRFDERVLDIRVKDENVLPSITTFLDALGRGEQTSESESVSETIKVMGAVCGEATFVGGEFVHLTAVRDEEYEAPAGFEANLIW